jgi:radical SAM protein with 4Fe4S-binding SPASM domain
MPAARLEQVEWLLTARCNLRCLHCSTWRSGSTREFSTAEALSLADALGRLRVAAVTLSGGEPFARADLGDICARLSAQGVAVQIATNGTLITSEKARRLAAAGLRAAQVSLDGADPATHDRLRGMRGAFTSAVRAIAALQNNGVPHVGISVTVSALNVDQLEGIIRLASLVGARSVDLRLCLPHGKVVKDAADMAVAPARYRQALTDFVRWRKEFAGRLSITTLDPLLALVDPQRAAEGARLTGEAFTGCGAGRNRCCIWPNGNLTPCAYCDEVAGNARQEDIATIWRTSPVLEPYRSLAALIHGPCVGCEHKHVCAAGCKSRSYGAFGAPGHPDPMCWVAEKRRAVDPGLARAGA